MSINADKPKFELSDKELLNYAIENGIIDPAKVTRTALQNALSVATMIISTKVLIAEDKETKEEKRI